jgi:signal peptidase I
MRGTAADNPIIFRDMRLTQSIQPARATPSGMSSTTGTQPVPSKTLGRSLAEIVLMLALLWVIGNATVHVSRFDDDSMKPVFAAGQSVLVDKLAFRFRPPQRGEVVVLRDPQTPTQDVVRRIIGLPGERVEFVGGQVLINGRPLREVYIIVAQSAFNAPRDPSKQLQLGPNQFFVMSDNRATGIDSRDWGPITTDQMTGRAWAVFWPLDEARFVERERYD